LGSKCLVMQTTGNNLGLSRTQTFGGDLRENVSGCHPDFQSFILFFLYVCSLVSLLWLVYIVRPLYYYSSVLKSTLFSPNSFPQSSLSIPDLCCPSEIKTFRCYKGTAYKLRPSPFGIYLWSLESVILLPEPNSLTRKNIPWNFNESCKLAFLTLKQAFISALVLTHYKPGCLLVIETNASDYALAAILSQVESNREIHPVTYLSRTFLDTKLNYNTHDKELMAIYEAFKAWRHFFEGTEVPIDIVMDYKNLGYFCTTRILYRRQAWWSTFLSGFDMVVIFRPGHLGTKPDALTCWPDLYPKGEGKPYGTVNP
jgi:RNase H-like domain found in reverse transcriptase